MDAAAAGGGIRLWLSGRDAALRGMRARRRHASGNLRRWVCGELRSGGRLRLGTRRPLGARPVLIIATPAAAVGDFRACLAATCWLTERPNTAVWNRRR